MEIRRKEKMSTNKSYKLMSIFPIILLSLIFLSVIPSVSSSDSDVINTFLTYDDASAISKTVTQGDSFNVYLIAYGHGESLQYERLEFVSSTLIFQEYVAGEEYSPDNYLYTKTLTLNTGILIPGTYTLRFTAKTATTQSEEYSDLQLTILPKIIPPVCGDNICNGLETCSTCPHDCGICPPICGNNIKETGEECDSGTLNGQSCTPLYGSSCNYCSSSCKLVTVNGPFCGDKICNSAETCSTCPGDCGTCPDNIKPVVDITYPLAVTYTSQRTSLIFSVYDDNLNSCTYKLNGFSPVNVASLVNGVNTITGISSITGTNTWTVTCKDNSGNTGTDSVTFTVTCPPKCGDGTCNGAENCTTCPTDCGICPPKCGDNICNGAENCSTCPTDCGICPPKCGDNICNGAENCSTCPHDCGVCPPKCGDNICNGVENCSTCPHDCGVCPPKCGDGTCNGNENCTTCPTDCGTCPDNIKPVVDITYPLAVTYTSQRTSLIFSVYDDNLQSCTYKLNSALPVNIPSISNGIKTVTGISSITGINTWAVTCKDNSGNTGTDSVIFTVNIPIPPTCGDGTCNGNENCSTCPTDCGICPKNCTICKDSKPLDDSGYDYLNLNKKTTIISEDTTVSDLANQKEKSFLENKYPIIVLGLIVGVLILLILMVITKLIKR
jgi:hypothetical protein